MEKETSDRYYVLGQIVQAVNLLTKSPRAHVLLPEIRSNLVMAANNADSIEDVAGIPGRITEVFGHITVSAYPAWGASRNTAMILLAVRKHVPECRAVMEIKYSPDILKIIETLGLNAAALELGKFPLEEVFTNLFKDGNTPEILYTAGGFAREGAIIITGKDAVAVAQTVIKIAERAQA